MNVKLGDSLVYKNGELAIVNKIDRRDTQFPIRTKTTDGIYINHDSNGVCLWNHDFDLLIN